MIVDALLRLTDTYPTGESVSNSTTATTHEVVDFAAAGDAVGGELSLKIICSAAPTGSANSITFKLRTASALSSGALSSPTEVASYTVASTKFKKGAVVVDVRLPKGLGRYIDLQSVATAATTTAAKVNAVLVNESTL